MRRTAPPATDEQLAAAEATEIVKRNRRERELEDMAEQERLAAAGDPEAREAVAQALRASASILDTRPIQPEESEQPPAPRRRKVAEAKTASPEQPELPESPQERGAYRLLDTALKKWRKKAPRSLRDANRELAYDLGSDLAIFMEAGIMRLSDGLDAINKLTVIKGEKEKTEDETDEFENQMEEMRRALRGG